MHNVVWGCAEILTSLKLSQSNFLVISRDMEVYKTTEMPCALEELKKAIVSYINRPVDK